MIKGKALFVAGITGLLLLATGVFAAVAQAEGQIIPIQTIFRYPIKFACGTVVADPTAGEVQVVNGVYRTAINVHNPALGATAIARFAKKVAFAFPSQQSGGVSPFVEARLGPNLAFEIDCDEILGKFWPLANPGVQPPPFLKGFVVIMSPVELDVTAVYTARPSNGEVSTMDVEVIQPKTLRPAITVQPVPLPN